MKTKTFNSLKNEIIYRVTGKTLIPDEANVEINYDGLLKMDTYGRLSNDNCIYCKLFFDDDPTTIEGEDGSAILAYNCIGCPMNDTGNSCVTTGTHDVYTEFDKLNQIWKENLTDSDVIELKELINKYNSTAHKRVISEPKSKDKK